jgi:hypothetical protein
MARASLRTIRVRLPLRAGNALSGAIEAVRDARASSRIGLVNFAQLDLGWLAIRTSNVVAVLVPFVQPSGSHA